MSSDGDGEKTANASVEAVAARKCRLSGLKVAIAGVYADSFGYGIIIPFIPFFVDTFEKDPVKANQWVGAILSAQYLGIFMGAFLMGYVTDKLGPKRALCISLAGDVVFFLLGAFAKSGELFLLTRLASGISSPSLPAETWVVKNTTSENRPTYYSMLMAGAWLGILLGAGGGVAVADVGISGALYLSSSVAFVVFVIALFAEGPEENAFEDSEGNKHTENQALKAITFQPVYAILVIHYLVNGFISGALPAMSPLTLIDFYNFNEREVAAYLLGTVCLLLLVIVLFYKRLLAFLKPWAMLIILGIGQIVFAGLQPVCLAFLTEDQPAPFITIRTFNVLFDGLSFPTVGIVAANLVDIFIEENPRAPAVTGRVMGLGRSIQSFGQIASPFLATTLYNIAFYYPFVFNAALSTMMVLIYLCSGLRDKLNQTPMTKNDSIYGITSRVSFEP